MKKVIVTPLLILSLFVGGVIFSTGFPPSVAHAQVEAGQSEGSTVDQPVSDLDLVQSGIDATKKIGDALKQEGVSKTVIFYSIILVIAQLLIQVTRSSLFGRLFVKVGHNAKLAIVSVLTVITTAVPMLLSGVGLWATLTSGLVLSAIMVAGNQVYQGFFKKGEPVAPSV